MQIKLIEAPGVLGGYAYALCDDAGELIGQQTSVEIKNEVGQQPTVTVTFRVDGETLRFAR